MYGCHGVFTQSWVGKPGTPKEDRTFIDAGIWRFHPVKKKFEIFACGLSNPWGFDFNDVGHGFATCCVIPHLFHVVQGGFYHKQSKAHVNPYVYDDIKTIRDHTHLSAHGGARFYLADNFPEKYRDQLFMCNIHEHAVLTEVMVPNGSSYIGQHGEDFMPTNDLAWVGFSVEIGPDGGVYILDWHDTDICGNAINFPDSGRIYRIMPKGAKKIVRPNIGELSDLELVAMQSHANDWYVRQARVELHYRSAAGKLDQKAVYAALEKQFTNAVTSPKRLRALWAMHVSGAYLGDRKEALIALLSHDDAHIRAWSVQLLTEDKKLADDVLAKFYTPCSLKRTVKIPANQKTTLKVRASYHSHGDWQLRVLANKAVLHDQIVSSQTVKTEWLDLEIDLSKFAGKSLDLILENKANNWMNEFGYWGSIKVVTK
jgi:hypothetical protein